MKIKHLAPSKLKPYKSNPRTCSDEAVVAVAQSIEEFGFVQPIVVDKDMVVIIGHTRLKAAISLGLDKVPVEIKTDLTAVQVKALRLNDNRLSENTSWEQILLSLEVGELEESEFDLGLLSFDEAELARILDREEDFRPNLGPDTAGGIGVDGAGVTGAEENQSLMGERSKQILVEVTCPKCAAEFFLQPESMKE